NIQSEQVGYLCVDCFFDETVSFNIQDKDGNIWIFHYKGGKSAGSFIIVDEKNNIELRVVFHLTKLGEPWETTNLAGGEFRIGEKRITVDCESRAGFFRCYLRFNVSIT
ncbi:unnamed protein product, partial [marine sediment metagenome]